MARKKKHPEHENLERWLVSYADFITLLFAFFTVMYALSYQDAQKVSDFAKSFSEEFERPTSSGVGIGFITANLGGRGTGRSFFTGSMVSSSGSGSGEATAKLSINVIRAVVNQKLDQWMGSSKNLGHGASDDQQLKVVSTQRGIVITLLSTYYFARGSAKVKSVVYPILDSIAEILRIVPNRVEVEGHTDNLPIKTKNLPSNWELSSFRASSIVRYLSENHSILPERLSVVGYGATRPHYSNSTEMGRRQNRRVNIVILYEEGFR